jgi:hypothetical protein
MIWYIVIYVALAAAVFGGLIWTYRTREPSRRMGSVVRPRRPELISILVPFREDTTRRTRNWEWLEKFYRESILDGKIEIIEGEDDHFPFCKTAAVNDAFRKSKGDVIVVMDADCYIKPGRILEAATLIRAARKRRKFVWFVPYRRFYRLDEWASDRLLESNPAHPWFIPDPPPPDYFDHKNNISSGHWWGALITVLPREAFMAIGGMDERFSGWGGEDVSFMYAMDTLWARHKTLDGPVFHLWHEMVGGFWQNTRQWEGQPKAEMNEALAGKYYDANGDVAVMRALVKGEDGS